MTQEEILEYNKRCAEFLGISTGYFKDEIDCATLEYQWMCVSANCTYQFEKEDYTDKTVYHYLKFHSDWNWIMEVCEAIEKLYDHPNKEVNIDIRPGQIEIFQRPYRLENNDYHEVIYLNDGYINNSKKQAVVQAINQFLIWYNENKTN